MPNTRSAKKRLRQNVSRRDRNRAFKTSMRTQVKKVRQAISDGNIEQAEEQFRLAARKLDRAGSLNIIHRNAAARVKSRLQKAIKAVKQSG